MKCLAILSAVVCSVAMCASAAQASLINIDFGNGTGNAALNYSGAAVVGAPGDTWNIAGAGDATNVALVDSGSATTTVTLSYSGTEFIAGGNIFGSTQWSALMTDYIHDNKVGDLHVTLSGLQAGEYHLYLYGAGSQVTRTGGYTVTTSAGSSYVTIGPNPTSSATFLKGVTYEDMLVTVGSNGQLTIAGQAVVDYAVLNGIQLQSVAVPEPATDMLMLSAISGLLAYAWRKRKN